MDRTDVSFLSGGQRCDAWLYRPDDSKKLRPLVIMGHGLGANKQMHLDAYAQRFVAAGMSVLAFDYRHFGASEGEPRQLLDIGKQREDWRAAIAYGRALPGIDSTRIALWGTSFGGGHVISVAAEDPYIAAVVAQCPFTSGLRSATAMGPVTISKIGALATADILSSPFRKKPVGVALAGNRGQAALMSADDVVSGFGRLSDESDLYQPKVAARFGLAILVDAPWHKAEKLKMPVFYAICDKDTVAPISTTLKAAEKSRHATVKRYPVGHFDIYYGDAFEEAVRDQTEFLTAILRP